MKTQLTPYQMTLLISLVRREATAPAFHTDSYRDSVRGLLTLLEDTRDLTATHWALSQEIIEARLRK